MIDLGSLPKVVKWVGYWDEDGRAQTILIELFVLEHWYYLPKERLPWEAWPIFGHNSQVAEYHSMLFDTEWDAAAKLVEISKERLDELNDSVSRWKSRLVQAMGLNGGTLNCDDIDDCSSCQLGCPYR